VSGLTIASIVTSDLLEELGAAGDEKGRQAIERRGTAQLLDCTGKEVIEIKQVKVKQKKSSQK
jgi:hypothetical protein